MYVCPECASTLCVPLCDPGDHPVFSRCMLCGTTFLADGAPGAASIAPGNGARAGHAGGHQVKVRVTASGLLDDPLRVAQAWAEEIARSGDPIPVGVGTIVEQPSVDTEVTLLLMIAGVTNPSAAQETARRRCAAIERLDARVREIRPVTAISTTPREYARA